MFEKNLSAEERYEILKDILIMAFFSGFAFFVNNGIWMTFICGPATESRASESMFFLWVPQDSDPYTGLLHGCSLES